MLELLRAEADCSSVVAKDAYQMVIKLYGRMKGKHNDPKVLELALNMTNMSNMSTNNSSSCSSNNVSGKERVSMRNSGKDSGKESDDVKGRDVANNGHNNQNNDHKNATNSASDSHKNPNTTIKEPSLITREDVHRMFLGDTLALDIAINLLIVLSQNIVVILAQKNVNDTKFYAEALELAMGSCKLIQKLSSNAPSRHSSHNSTMFHNLLSLEENTLHHVDILNPVLYDIVTPLEKEEKIEREGNCKEREKERERRESRDISAPQFYLRDFTVIFPILSGLALRLLHGSKPVVDLEEILTVLCSTFLTLSRQHGDAMHVIRALHLQSMFFNRINRLRQSVTLCDEICEIYVFEKHSTQMAKIYGGDRGIGAMAAAAVGYVEAVKL